MSWRSYTAYMSFKAKDTINRDNPKRIVAWYAAPISARKSASTRMLMSRVFDHNYYAIEEAKTTKQQHRPIGLGVMGLADYLYQRGLHFEHPDTPQVMEALFKTIKHEAVETGRKLAMDQGCYASWQGSRWEKQGIPMRKSHLLAIAPKAFRYSRAIHWTAVFSCTDRKGASPALISTKIGGF